MIKTKYKNYNYIGSEGLEGWQDCKKFMKFNMEKISSEEIQLECGQRSDRLLSARRFKRFLSQSYIGFLHSQSGNILVVSNKGTFQKLLSRFFPLRVGDTSLSAKSFWAG